MQLTRRHIMFGLGPAAGALAAASAGAAQRGSAPTDTDRQTVDALKDVVNQLRAQGDPPVIAVIRESQRSFLRNNQRFPEYIEVGVSVWEQMYDWHIHTGQPLQVVRLNDGRYGMSALMSTLVLNLGALQNYVGPGTALP